MSVHIGMDSVTVSSTGVLIPTLAACTQRTMAMTETGSAVSLTPAMFVALAQTHATCDSIHSQFPIEGSLHAIID